jgi:hypothetical protein
VQRGPAEIVVGVPIAVLAKRVAHFAEGVFEAAPIEQDGAERYAVDHGPFAALLETRIGAWRKVEILLRQGDRLSGGPRLCE